jgi:hypothetical protein
VLLDANAGTGRLDVVATVIGGAVAVDVRQDG